MNSIQLTISFLLTASFTLTVLSCTGNSDHTGSHTKQLNFYNWSYYIAESTIPDFERAYDVHVNYDNFSSNEELLAKLQAGVTGYDLMVPSDFMVEIMIKLDLLEPLDVTLIPNIRNINPRFKNMPFDPDGLYSVPYQWGTAGLGINTAYVKEHIDSWSILWDETYRGRISVLDHMRSGLVPALKLLGYSVNETDERKLMEARDLMFKQKDLVKAYSSDTYMDLLKSGDIWIAQGWSGDIYQVAKDNPDIIFVIPKEGTYVWVDNLVIPKNAPNKRTAELFINYILQDSVGADISNFTGYSTPNLASLPLINPEILADSSLYPDDSTMARCEFMHDVGMVTRIYNSIWNEIKSK